MYYVYIVRCTDGTLYTGITTDVVRRVEEHNTLPVGAKYTRGRRPVTLVYSAACSDRANASKEEARIKRLSRRDKMKLIRSTSDNTR
jgi:putative endonuclease